MYQYNEMYTVFINSENSKISDNFFNNGLRKK